MSTDTEERWEGAEIDRLFSAVASDHCRFVVSYFRDRPDDVATLDELVAYGSERGDTGQDDAEQDDAEQDDAERGDEEQSDEPRTTDPLAVRLHHSTLPKLADSGVIDYDDRTHTVRYWGHPLVD